MNNRKKEHDLRRASLLSIIYLIIYGVTMFIGNTIAWVCFAFITAIIIVYIYMDHKNEQERKKTKKKDKLFIQQYKNYMQSVYEEDFGD